MAFLEWCEESFLSLVGRESAAVLRQNREVGTPTFSLEGGEGRTAGGRVEVEVTGER